MNDEEQRLKLVDEVWDKYTKLSELTPDTAHQFKSKDDVATCSYWCLRLMRMSLTEMLEWIKPYISSEEIAKVNEVATKYIDNTSVTSEELANRIINGLEDVVNPKPIIKSILNSERDLDYNTTNYE